MLTEEALILLATLGASGMLVLGVLELVAPSMPRRPMRRPRLSPPRPAAAAPARADAPPAPVEPPPVERALTAEPAPVPEIAAGTAIVTEPGEETKPSLPDVRSITPSPSPPPAPQPGVPRRPGSVPRAARTPRTVEWRRSTTSIASAAAVPVAEPAPRITELKPVVAEPASPVAPEPTTADLVAEPMLAAGPVRAAADVEPGPVVPEPVVAAAPEPLRLVEEPAAPVEETPSRVPAGDPSRDAARPRLLPIDTCLTMYKEHRYAEVVSLGSAALEVHARMAAVSDRSDEAAALQDLVGLSKQELGDRDGARLAFCAAIAGAESFVRPTYVRHLVTLIRWVVDGVNVRDDDAVRIRELQSCLAAVERALEAAPDAEPLTSAQTAVRQALSSLCERLVARAVEDEGDRDARDLVLEVLGDEAMPAPWREKLREQLATASSAEIGQLTAQAIRAVQEGKDGEALEALERAERLAESLPSAAVADERREELERRLWWGYTKVGLRRVETRKFEGALEPLFRALRLGGIDEERLGETRGALVRALDGLVDVRWAEIQKLGEEDRAAARADAEKLWTVLRSATERGIAQEDLAEAFAKVMHLGQTLSQGA